MFQCVHKDHEGDRMMDGEPAVRNGAGDFCQRCKERMIERSIQSKLARSRALNGKCIWCGDKILPQKNGNGKSSDHVCDVCENGRTWLLRCIRYSDRVAKYVAKRDAEEAPVREDRIRAEKLEQERKQKETDAMIDALPTETEVRLANVERLLNKLLTELGA